MIQIRQNLLSGSWFKSIAVAAITILAVTRSSYCQDDGSGVSAGEIQQGSGVVPLSDSYGFGTNLWVSLYGGENIAADKTSSHSACCNRS